MIKRAGKKNSLERNTCFVIIPFHAAFDDICAVIRQAVEKDCKLRYVRGDLHESPGRVMPQIEEEIRRATVIVADISGHNPNVFYELGIAHQIKGPERVVLLTQAVDGKKAYDVHHYRQLEYTHSLAGLAKLRQELPVRLQRAIEAGANEEFWNIIRGRLPRTRVIVRELQRLIDSGGKKGLKGVTIRVVAGLSSLAISDHEPVNRSAAEYHRELIKERNLLQEALVRGARLKAVLNPIRRFPKGMLPDRLRVRYERLIGLLQGRSDIRRNPRMAARDLKAFKQCQFVLSPVPMPNLLIIGDTVAYEGMKRAGTGGFEMTHCETNPAAVQEMIGQFDEFFDESHEDTSIAHPTSKALAESLQRFLDEALAHQSR